MTFAVGLTAPGRGSVRCSRGCGHVIAIVIVIIGRLAFSTKAGMNGDLTAVQSYMGEYSNT